jgi:GT2 family glycosyltransferase
MKIRTPTAEQNNHGCSRTESDATSATRLSIVLVNYNGMKFIGPCLESIHQFAPANSQVILEDNASTDGSIEVAEREYLWVEIVRSDGNLGFAGGNNLAAKRAVGKYILLLNTDTLLLEPIEPVVDWLENHPGCGALTINMLDGNRNPSACTGRFPTPIRLASLRRMLISPESYDSAMVYDVDWVQGSFLLIPADLWRALNGLDESYFMYGEDVDLCKRVWDTGHCCTFLPHWKYLHWGGFQISRFPDQISSLATFVDHHMTGPRRQISWAVLLVGCLLRAVVYQIGGMIKGRSMSRSKASASWRAFKALVGRLA